ncbi:MAG: cupredoxin domain-containing protein [Candidatus Micrarchaeota archaeon]
MDDYVVAAVMIAALTIAFFMSQAGASGDVNAVRLAGASIAKVAATPGEVVVVPLRVEAGRYSPSEIRVAKGTTVRIEAEANTFTGCMRTLVIGGYGVRKLITAADNIVEFVADKPGAFPISCTMGMGGGRLLVEDDGGSVPESPLPVRAAGSGGSCGAGGGCGCGG